MPRIRYLKPSFWSDSDIAKLDFVERLCYQGLWNQADKEGRLTDKPAELKVSIFPYDIVDMEAMLNRLSHPKEEGSEPFILRYRIGTKRYIQINTWLEHQKPHHTEKDSTIPSPENGEIILNNIPLPKKELEVEPPAEVIAKPQPTINKSFMILRDKIFKWAVSQYPAFRRKGKDVALKRYEKTVTKMPDILKFKTAFNNYKDSEDFQHGFVLRMSKWFDSWEEYIELKEEKCTICDNRGKFVSDRGYEIICSCIYGQRIKK